MPIQYALTYPARDPGAVPRLDWTESRNWTFSPPDLKKFPALRLAYQVLRAGGSAACTLNAADEVAVEAFLAGQISFPSIARVVEDTLSRVPNREAGSVQEILEIDEQSRTVARNIVRERADGAGLVSTLAASRRSGASLQ
jgi:1-deoxy-D-xylulose-5-phosphate reductoisomerase